MSRLSQFPMFYVPFLFALCFHEVAHGWVARRKGDPTAFLMGRLTMNPLVHMDIVGTLVMPFLAFMTGIPIFFGWAKPVPVNSRNLKNPRADMFWIALAGPASNILLAIVGSFLLYLVSRGVLPDQYVHSAAQFIDSFIVINLFLAVFNIIPIHPLDGGKILARFLPNDLNNKLEQNEQYLSLILMLLIFSGFTRFLIYPVQFVHNLITFWMVA